MEVNIKYFDKELTQAKKIEKGDWIDLRCAGVTKLEINNNINKVGDINVLTRDVVKTKLPMEDGLFIDEKGEGVLCSFFRYKAGDVLLIDLGIAMQLPENKEAHVVPRGSTFKALTVIETNSMGIIDETYKGDGDKWFMPVLAMQDGFVLFDERVCQFKIENKMEHVNFNELEKFNTVDRGALGSTGIK